MMRRTDKSPVATWWWTIDRWFLAAFLSLMVLGVVLLLVSLAYQKRRTVSPPAGG